MHKVIDRESIYVKFEAATGLPRTCISSINHTFPAQRDATITTMKDGTYRFQITDTGKAKKGSIQKLEANSLLSLIS